MSWNGGNRPAKERRDDERQALDEQGLDGTHFERGLEGLSRNLEKRDAVEKRYFQVRRHRHEYERDIERVEQRHADDEGGKQ